MTVKGGLVETEYLFSFTFYLIENFFMLLDYCLTNVRVRQSYRTDFEPK